MRDNLRLYHMMFRQLRHWLPGERVTRQRNLALLVVGLFLAGSVHLPLIGRKLPGRAKKWSRATRLRRFLGNPGVTVRTYYEPLLTSLLRAVVGQQLVLIVDMTVVGPWHRALVVAMAYRGRALPLAWSVHRGTRGNLPIRATLTLLDYLYQLLPFGLEVTLLGDGDFRSSDLLRWLQQREWHYVIHQRGQVTVQLVGRSEWVALGQIPIQQGETQALGWLWIAKTNPFGPTWLLLHWAKGEEEPWLLVSDRADAPTVLRLYRKRSYIEAMFGDMKQRGFDLEKTRLARPERIERLLLAIAMAYVWLMALGSWVVKNGYRRHIDRPDRRDLSYFRLGWDWIDDCFSRGSPLHLRFIPYYL